MTAPTRGTEVKIINDRYNPDSLYKGATGNMGNTGGDICVIWLNEYSIKQLQLKHPLENIEKNPLIHIVDVRPIGDYMREKYNE